MWNALLVFFMPRLCLPVTARTNNAAGFQHSHRRRHDIEGEMSHHRIF